MVISRDVVFDEMAAWDWEGPGTGEAGSLSSTFVVEHLVIHGGGDAGEEVSTTPGVVPSGPTAMPTTPAVVPSSPAAMPTTPAEQGGHGPPIEFTSPPTDIDEYVDAFHDGEEVRFRRVDNIVGEGELLGWPVLFSTTQSCSLLVQRSHRCLQWLRATTIGAKRCWKR